MLGLVALVALTQSPALSASDASYEQQLIDWGLAQHGRVLEPFPEGKTIEAVLVASEEIFSPSDPWPRLLNLVHVRTKERIVQQEVALLFKPGDRYVQAQVQETERNLRRLFIFGVARVVPVQGTAGGVALLVVTKDRWSLRLNSQFTLIGGLLQFLRLQPTEQNFLGNNQQVALDVVLRLDTLSLGQSFVERRLFGSRLNLTETAGLVLNRQTGRPEGTYGAVYFGRPLISLDQQWSFGLEGSWRFGPRREFRGANVWQLDYPDAATASRTVPYIYDRSVLGVEAAVTRRLGSAVKADVSLALGRYARRYSAPAASALSEAEAAWFTANWLPRTEDATYALAYLTLFTPTFAVVRNIDSYQLSEDLQLGPRVNLGARWGLPAPLSTAGFVELGGSARWRFLVADDLLTLSAAGTVRLRSDGPPANLRYAFELANVSPPFQGGRFVSRVTFEARRNDLDNARIVLGGSNGLRGTLPEVQQGRTAVLANFEYRTRPFELLTTYTGLVLFYDVGTAFEGQPAPLHTVGVGLRILLPQFNADPIRIDFGFQLGGPNASLNNLNATFGQITDFRPALLDSPL